MGASLCYFTRASFLGKRVWLTDLSHHRETETKYLILNSWIIFFRKLQVYYSKSVQQVVEIDTALHTFLFSIVQKDSKLFSFAFCALYQGITRLFLTRIPFFREVIVSSFSCDECGYKNAELQPGGRIQERGVSYKLTVKDKAVSSFVLVLILVLPSSSREGYGITDKEDRFHLYLAMASYYH